MTGHRYLLERLAGIAAEDFDVRQAVAAQVQRLLTTIPIEDPDEALAEGPHLLNFGMPPLVDLGFITPSEREMYAEHLRALLKAFEPRLTDPEVEFTDAAAIADPLGIEIRALLNPGEEEEIIRFRVDRDGMQES
jgi:predicted component of type VI protein secretion system